MKVRAKYLLLLASAVWTIAGLNVMILGLKSYGAYQNILNYFLSILIFCIFEFAIFAKMVNKHTLRISAFGDTKQFFYKFFDKKSFLIMICMISFGILLRKFHIVSEKFIAIFYTGLGAALLLAGLLFTLKFFRSLNRINKK